MIISSLVSFNLDVTVLVYGMKQEIHWNILHEMEETKINFYIEGQASFPSPGCKILFYKFYNYTGQKEYSNKVWNSHQTVEGFGNIP